MKKKLSVLILLLLVALPLALAGCDKKGDKWVAGAGTFVDLSVMPEGTAQNYEYLYDQIVVGDEALDGKDYLGHPDSVLLDNGNILTAFPMDHGKGETIMKLSTDRGLTWTNIFDEDNPKPASFADTEETPTIYKLDFTDGSQKLICISGRPGWVQPSIFTKGKGEGFDVTVSESLDNNGSCDGLVWSEHENFFGPNAQREEYVRPRGEWNVIVAMSSLTRLKDESGNYIDKWMGTFHDYDFIVYKTYLTFDADGQMQWTEPVRLLGQDGEYRQAESTYQFCETEVLRSPDGNELAAIFRVNAKTSYSFVSFSTDEGETWSEPQTVSAELTGERHKAEYDPATGKLVITFRSIYYTGDPSSKNYYSLGWVAWIGDYEDLKHGAEGKGDLVVKLAHTYSSGETSIPEDAHANSDTGYAGLVAFDDGLFVTTSYGPFSPADDAAHGGDTYIVAKRFTVSDIASLAGVKLR